MAKNELATILEAAIAKEVKGTKKVALLLSGGVDSLSVGFAAEAAGYNIHAYTFQVENIPSEDAMHSEAMSKKLGWNFTKVVIPIGNLEKDFLEMAKKWKCKGKLEFECFWPFLYMIPAIKETHVLSGIGADMHFGLDRWVKLRLHGMPTKEARKEFKGIRYYSFFKAKNLDSEDLINALVTAHGKVSVMPYRDVSVYGYFIKFLPDQINKPVEKFLTLSAYPDKFKLVGRRDHANLHKCGKVDVVFESLLNSKLNTKRRTRVMDLCRDYATGHGT